MMQLVKDTYRSWGAEVVFITSNWVGNKEIMEGCKAAGIPAFVRRLSLSHLGHAGPSRPGSYRLLGQDERNRFWCLVNTFCA